MGSVTRRTLAAILVAAPAVTALVTLPGSAATAFPAVATQAGEAKVGTTNNLKFDPANLTVAAGTKITWTNTGGGYHTVTGGENTPDPNNPIGRGVIDTEGKTYSVTIDKPGTYKYYCEPHLSIGMVGTVTVTAAGAGATTAPTSAAPAASSAPPASAGASATVGAPQQGAGAPTGEPVEGGSDEVPGVADNPTLKSIEEQRAAQSGAVSGFRFFTAVATAFLFILGAAVMFSTRPRRAGR